MGKGKPRTRVKPDAGGGALAPKVLARNVLTRGAENPTFSFHHADRAHDGSWSWPQPDAAAELLDFLCNTARRTWGEIRADTTGGRNRHRKHHEMGFDTVSAEAQKRLTDLHLDEIFEELFRFRIGGKKRLWGFEVDGVFHVLWWDAEHQVYPSEP